MTPRKPNATKPAPPTGKEARLELLLTASDKAAWQTAAVARGITVAVLVRRAVNDLIASPNERSRLADLGREVLAMVRDYEASP